MKVKLTLLRDGFEPADVIVTADSTATAADVARHVADADPARTIIADTDDVLTLAVAPPTDDRLEPLAPGVHIGEAPIGSGFAASVVNLGPPGRDAAPVGSAHGDTVGVLRAAEGPLQGQEFALTTGHATVGRLDTNDIVLDDPMVSKTHARLEVSNYVELVDLNSANGVSVDGAQVQRVRLVPGKPFVIGGTTLVLYLARDFDGVEDPVLERGGGLHFNRSPRVDVRYPGIAHPGPRMPSEMIDKLFPWTMLVAPIIMAGAIYAITGRERALLLIFMTPLMAMGNFINQRSQTTNKKNHEVELFERQFEHLEETLFRSKPEEEQARNDEVPPVAEVYEHAMRLGPLLWTRRPEHWNYLALRLGTTRRCRATPSRSRTPRTVCRSTSSGWTAFVCATGTSTTSHSWSRCGRSVRWESPAPRARRPMPCGAWGCSCSACTRRTRWSPWPSPTTTGPVSWSG